MHIHKLGPEALPLQCGRYKPDFTWEIEAEQRVVILECDENAHRDYVIRCEFYAPHEHELRRTSRAYDSLQPRRATAC